MTASLRTLRTFLPCCSLPFRAPRRRYNGGFVHFLNTRSAEDAMSVPPLTDFSRLCVHTITTKPWSIEEATTRYAAAGVRGVTVWRQWLDGRDIAQTGRALRDAGIEIVSLCRGGFFPAVDQAGRRVAIDDNLRAIDEAVALGAPLIVLVCGAVPDRKSTRLNSSHCD
jgi:hypothetical protein